MIHSFEIQFPLSSYAASYCIFQLNYPRQVYKLNPQYRIKIWEKKQINSFFEQPNDKSFYSLEDSDIQKRVPGIIKVLFLHIYNQDYLGDQYFIRIRINPCSLLLKRNSEDLFYCTPNNNRALQNAYAKIIFNLFPRAFINPSPLDYDKILKTNEYTINRTTGEKIYLSEWLAKFRTLAALPYLGLASVKRVDNATNLDLPKNFQQFLKLAKRSALDKRKTLHLSKCNDELELINKSKTFAVYERIKINNECFAPQGIIRFKAILRKPSIEWRKNSLKISTERDSVKLYNRVYGGLLPFLSNKAAVTLINNEYNKLVGSGNFLSTYKAWKTIDESKFKKDKKQSLKELMQLVSQCWSLRKAEVQYINGAPLKKSRKIVKGTQQTFRKSIKQLRDIGVQPLRIPDSWHLSYLHNPIADDVNSKILFGPVSLRLLLSKESFKKYEETKAEIERLLKVRKLENSDLSAY